MPCQAQPLPNGLCWCDCGGRPAAGSFFLPGHEKTAERYLAAINNASTLVQRLADRGFVPGQVGLRAAVLASAAGYYEECGLDRADGQPCPVIGRGDAMTQHRSQTHRHRPAHSATSV